MWRQIMHFVALAQFSFAIYYDLVYVHLPEVMGSYEFRNFDSFGGKSKYMSLWNLVLQTIFFGICTMNDIFGSNEINPKPKPQIRKIKDYLLASIAFPTAMLIALSFWALYILDRELAFPKFLDQHVPTWLNHVIHTNTLLFSILEVGTSFRTYPQRLEGLAGMLTFVATYVIWTLFIYSKTGEWVYPIFKKLSWGNRFVLWVGLFGVSALLYLVGEYINNKIWAKEVKQLASQEKSNKKRN